MADTERKTKYNREYYPKNKEKFLNSAKKYRENNPEKMKEYRKRYYLKNRDKLLESTRKWRERNKDNEQYKERNREKAREFRKNNPEKIRQYVKKYRDNNLEKIKILRRQYKRAHREVINEQKKQNYRIGAIGTQRHYWDDWEDELVMEHKITDRELAKKIKHSVAAIQSRRVKLNKWYKGDSNDDRRVSTRNTKTRKVLHENTRARAGGNLLQWFKKHFAR